MRDIKIEYRDEFLKRFTQSEIFKEEQSSFNNILGRVQWCLFSSATEKLIDKQLKEIAVTKTQKRTLLNKRYKKLLCSNINKAKIIKKPALFENNGFYNVCLPLGRGDNIYGYLVLSGLRKRLGSELLALLSSFTRRCGSLNSRLPRLYVANRRAKPMVSASGSRTPSAQPSSV